MKLKGIFESGTITGYNITEQVSPFMIHIFERVNTLTISNVEKDENGMFVVRGEVKELQELFSQWSIDFKPTRAKIQAVEKIGGVWEVTCKGVAKTDIDFIMSDPLGVITEIDMAEDKWMFRYSANTALSEITTMFD